MASSICQTNPLSAKFFIFFTEMLLAQRLSNGSVLPPDSWSIPPTHIDPASHLNGSRSSTDSASMSDQGCSSSPIKDVSILGTSHASNFLKSVLLGDYPIVKADSDNESCKEEDKDNDVEDEKYDNDLNKNGEEGDGEDVDDDEDEVKYDEVMDREKKIDLPRSLSKSSRRSTPEFSRGRNRSHSCTSNINIRGTLIDALSAEGKEKGKGEEVEVEVDVEVDVDIEGVQHEGGGDGDGEKEEAEETENDEEEEEEEGDEKDKEEDEDEDEDEDEEEEDVVDEVNDTMSGALSDFKDAEQMSDEKHSATLDDDVAEKKKPSIKTISPHTPSPPSLHSPPLKITEALRFLSVQKSNSTIWDQHAGLYALMSLVHLYFTNCASDWNVEEGDVAVQMCQSVHAVVEKKARHSSSSDFNDVSSTVDCTHLQSRKCLICNNTLT